MFISNYGAGAVTVIKSKVIVENTSIIANYARYYGLRILHCTLMVRKFNYNHNRGYINIFNSIVYLTEPVTLSGNIGGTIRAILSHIYFNSTEVIEISKNTANSGGGIMLRESELIIQSPVIISQNKAKIFGGGIYAYASKLEFATELKSGEGFIINNTAGQSGGGVCAVASTVRLSQSYLTIGSNTAQHSGGGLYLEERSKIYILKRTHEVQEIKVRLTIINNNAVYGGGLYVADNSTAGTLQCRGNKGGRDYDKSITQDCFIQTIQLYQIIRGMPDKVINTFIINNTAESGSALYGGLLDRCTVNAYAEIYDDELTGLQYINKTVMISKGSTIASDPVQVVFCGKQTQDTVVARKGKPFKVCVSAS